MCFLKTKTGKAIGCAIILLFTAGILFLLQKQAGVSNKTKEALPPLFDSPSYVELSDGHSLFIELTPHEDVKIAQLEMVIVNTDASGNGHIDFYLQNPEGDKLWETQLDESDIDVGKWTQLDNPPVSLDQGLGYLLCITPSGCEPFFIKTQYYAISRSLPFDEKVYKVPNGDYRPDESNVLDTGISMGAKLLSEQPLTYAGIFYYSSLIVIIASAAMIMLLLMGKDSFIGMFTKLNITSVWRRIGNNVFMSVLYITICLSIYVNGYLDGINISADSAGYLREAVNIAAGNGFHYDAIAGYGNTWFANWPILYPLMIGIVMKMTGAEVYLASKILSMILVGVLLLSIRLIYKEKAWIYSLCLTNMGLMYLYWYSWSELPFIVFIFLFAILLSKILAEGERKIPVHYYILLGIVTVAAFLTRYFGMFLFGVYAFYILLCVAKNVSRLRDEGKKLFPGMLGGKAFGLLATAACSGVCSLLYLVNNKLRNGMPSGVSRSMWWDDYETLTNDLIKALVTEFFNIFRVNVPEYVENLAPGKAALAVIVVSAVLFVAVLKNTKPFTRESVLITTSAIYYGMFIVIRYFSSMDTFYFRFFAPATLLFMLGFVGAFVEKAKTVAKNIIWINAALTALTAILAWGYITDHIFDTKLAYYDLIRMEWDEEYAEIPERSVIIFSNMDYRSLFYRPDVVEGTIDPNDTMESINNKYYGSDYMCILSNDAKIMLESDIYDDEINDKITDALKTDQRYCVISLK